MLAFPSARRAADAVWAEVPQWAKTIAFDRGARVVGWTPSQVDDDVWLSAASFAGIALAAATRTASADRGSAGSPPIDGTVVEREVAEALSFVLDPSHASVGEGLARRGAAAARAVFEQIVEVPRATIDRESRR